MLFRSPVTVVEERWIRFHPPLFGLVMRLGGYRVVVSSVSVELNAALLRFIAEDFFLVSRARSLGTYITFRVFARLGSEMKTGIRD